MPPDEFLSKIVEILEPKGWIDGESDVEFFVTEWRKLWHGHCIGVALPSSSEQVSLVLSLCNQYGVSVTPQGGNTGLVGGGVPSGGIVLSTRRLNQVRLIDRNNQTVTIEAGCTLASVQELAADNGLLFPLSLASEGICQIGGNLATNAGGVGVLRYGNARDLVLGLEVVLADGRVIDGLSGLRKDNTAYDLNSLFIGSEGTLGVITAATLKLFPKPIEHEVAVIALPDISSALSVFTGFRKTAFNYLSAFEIMNGMAISLVRKHIPDTPPLFDKDYELYALLELTSPRDDQALARILERDFSDHIENGLVCDAVIAASEKQRQALWRMRESIPEAQVSEGKSVKHDISVAVSDVPELVHRATRVVSDILPDVRIVVFGHMGDGNLHFNLSQPTDMDGQAFLDMWDTFNDAVHTLVVEMNGSFSAEHGIGTLKRKDLARFGSPVLLDAMQSIKNALDPQGIMNPGKVLPRSP